MGSKSPGQAIVSGFLLSLIPVKSKFDAIHYALRE